MDTKDHGEKMARADRDLAVLAAHRAQNLQKIAAADKKYKAYVRAQG